MALLERLTTDRSLAAFAGRFVPLKLTTDGNAEWSQFARQHPYEGRGIPILFVVRADGTKLYARSGSLDGAALPQMLLATLNESGRAFNDAEVALLEASLQRAKEALAEENQAAAALALGQLSKLGTVGDLKSFSELAIEADGLAKQVAETAQRAMDDAKEKLSDPQSAFDAVLTLIEAETAYAKFPAIFSQLTPLLRDARRNDALKEAFRQAEALERARRYASADNAAVRRRAEEAFAQVITRYPGTRAEELARADLAAISPDAAILSTPRTETVAGADSSAPEPVRTWKDSTGKFNIEAQYVQQKQGYVQLKKPDGQLISVQISRLSPADQQYLEGR